MSTSSKRKSEDDGYELIEETTNSRKRVKIEEIIFKAIREEEQNQAGFSESKFIDKSVKPVTSSDFKKRYKYHCKMHNVSYLVDCIRKERKEISRRNRNNLVQNFRSLTVSADSFTTTSENNADPTNQIDNAKNDDLKKDIFKKPELRIIAAQKRKTSDSPLRENKCELITPFKRPAVQTNKEESTLENYQDIDVFSSKLFNTPEKKYYNVADLVTPKLSLSTLPKLLDGSCSMSEYDSDVNDHFPRKFYYKKKGILPRKINFDNQDDSDCELQIPKKSEKQKKRIQNFVITKNAENGNIVFRKGFDYFETDSDDANDSDCNCSIYNGLTNESSDVEYSDFSLLEDEFDIKISIE